MPEQYFIVELRCGTCGLIFAAGSQPLRDPQADELLSLFRDKGPQRFQRCKNKCPREPQSNGMIIPGRLLMAGNYNQRVLKTHVPANEEQSQ